MTTWTERLANQGYNGIWRFMVPWMRVPRDPPTLPRSGELEARSFKPSEGFLSYMKFWFWALFWLMDLALLVLLIILLITNWIVFLVLLLPILALMIIPDLIAFVAIHLRYDSTWYVMNDRSVRIRRGIWTIHETTVSFENVQNVNVTQGPVQRYFKISNVIIETAGSGGSDHQRKGFGVSNKGVIEGIENAAEIRDVILARMRASKSAGLGDDETHERNEPSPSRGLMPSELALLREIRNELRTAVALAS